MILDDEFVTEDGRTLLSRPPDSAKRHRDSGLFGVKECEFELV